MCKLCNSKMHLTAVDELGRYWGVCSNNACEKYEEVE